MNAPKQPLSTPKKTYTRPTVIKYGDVRKLAQTATSGSSEGSSGSGPMKPGSDRRIKENVVRIGVHPLGIGIYLFDYKAAFREVSGHGRQFGVMADEVEKILPQAVSTHPRGFKVVDYSMLGIWRNSH